MCLFQRFENVAWEVGKGKGLEDELSYLLKCCLSGAVRDLAA